MEDTNISFNLLLFLEKAEKEKEKMRKIMHCIMKFQQDKAEDFYGSSRFKSHFGPT